MHTFFQAPSSPATRVQRRWILCLAPMVIAGVTSYVWNGAAFYAQTDFAQLWYAARALLHGVSPYTVLSFPLLYPMPAVLLAVPFSVVPLRLADALFCAVGAFALAWAITRDRLANPQWCAFGSVGYMMALGLSQWSPLLMGATALPALGIVWACKPTIGAALWCAYPSRRALYWAAGFAGLSLLIWPSWIVQWWEAILSVSHLHSPITHLAAGGPFILLAMLRWRRPEARLLTALACVPHSTFFYEALPLFLVVRRWYEGVALCALTFWASLLTRHAPPGITYDAWVFWIGDHIVFWLYLPCLIVVLCRPNVSSEVESASVVVRVEASSVTA